MNIWEPGSSEVILRHTLQAFIERWLKVDKYKSRLPRQHVHVILQGKKQPAGIVILIGSVRDEESTWIYTLSGWENHGRSVSSEYYMVTVATKSDKDSGGDEAGQLVASVVKDMFSCPDCTPERQDLIERGVYNLFESSGGTNVDPGSRDAATTEPEGTFFTSQLSLRCNTETFLN